MNYNKILWSMLFFFILIGTIQAEWNVSLQDIEKAKIDYSCLHMAILSPKGDYALGYEILDFYGQLFRIPKDVREKRIESLLETVGLAKDGKRNLKEYSKGMLQRIGIAQTLINEPDLVFLDEPTSGLDPIAHKDIQDIIFNLKKNGKTVFMSSHQLSDVENVCDRVAIIKRGKIVKMGTMEELLEDGITVITIDNANDELINQLSSFADKVKPDGKRYNIYVKNEENIYKVVDMVKSKANLVSVVPQKQSLEDLFVDIIRGGVE